MIYSLDVKEILIGIAVNEYGDLPWKPVMSAIDDLVMRFERTERPVLAAIRLDLAVLDLRLRLDPIQPLPRSQVQ